MNLSPELSQLLAELPSDVLPQPIDSLTTEQVHGYLPTLLWLASQPGVDEGFRQTVRRLRGTI